MTAYLNQLSDLYKITLTPEVPAADFWYYPEAKDIIEKAVLTTISSNYFTKKDNEDIKESILFFLRLINTPADLRGVSRADKCVHNIIISALKEENQNKTDFADKIKAIFDSWVKTLRDSPDSKSKFLKRPFVEASSVFYFHLAAAGIGGGASIPGFYEAYGYETHKCLRNIFSQPAATSSKDGYALSARYFFTHIDPIVAAITDYRTRSPLEFIDLFARQFDIDISGNYEEDLSELAVSHRDRLERLFAKAKIKRHSNDRSERTEIGKSDKAKKSVIHPRVVDGTPNILNKKDETPEVSGRIFKVCRDTDDEEERICEDFEAPDEMEVLAQEDSPEIVREKPSLRTSLADLINLRSFIFPWDSTYLNLYHYGLLYQKTETLWGKSSLHNAVITYLEVLANTGMDPRMLLDLFSKDSMAEEKMPRLKKHMGRLFILIDSLVKRKTEFSSSHCLETSAKVWVPVPLVTQEKISSIMAHGSTFVFGYTETAKVKRLSLLHVEKYLEEINDAYETNITPENISNSFLPMYHGRFDLDPLICVILSGQDHYRLYRTLLHYVHVPHIKLDKEYLQAHEKVQEAIRNNTEICIRMGLIKDVMFTERKTISKAGTGDDEKSAISFIPNSDKDDQCLDFGYGSPIICKKDYIVVAVKKLRNAIETEADFIRCHNLLTIYLYIFLQFCTCLRPRNKPEIYWANLGHYGTLTICDKQSAKYHEERSICLINSIQLLISRFKAEVSKLRTYLASFYSNVALMKDRDRLLFFIDEETGAPVDFTLKKMKAYLSNISIEWTLPPNFPRHFTSNYLYTSGIPLEAIEYWMGHQHAGREVLNITSSCDLPSIVAVILPLIEELVQELWFTSKIVA